ncbi:MAG TPA: HAD-IA family hydrolase [Aggregatilineales bacterium]|nr:HAD-IA family hydrolase [Anaerolineales bacterium]HRE48102.1 HAD-IA family hydrolase [Aggregatilineales bacterium]
MIKAVLFDLDDTLLRLNSGFLRTYMMGIGGLLGELAQRHPTKEEVQGGMRGAVAMMIANNDPTRFNREVFGTKLAESFGVDAAALQRAFDTFHHNGYQATRTAITPIPGAAELVDRLLAAGISLTVATNPFFPLDQVRMRMGWGGINPDLPFAWITNMDECHFTKPSPYYYEEILARVGVEPDEAIMVGDSYENDILPATQVGMYTYWIDDPAQTPLPPEPGSGAVVLPKITPHGQGTLAEFAALWEGGWFKALAQTPLPRLMPTQVAPCMVGNTGALFGIIDTALPEHWQKRPLATEWTPLEIICHLRDSERDVQRPRLERIAREDNPFIEPSPTPPAPGEMDVRGATAESAAAAFWAERQKTLTFLAELSPEQWGRLARHSVLGRTTLLEMAIFTTRHDRLHITQLCQTLGRCREE